MSLIRKYGRDRHFNDSNMDNVVVVNEDLGINANLVAGTNDTFETTLPYPSEWDPSNETMKLFRILFALELGDHPAVDSYSRLGVQMSMIDRSAVATYRGGLNDAADEWRKSQFTPPMHFGVRQSHGSVAATDVWQQLETERLQYAEYVPQFGPLPTFFPLFLEFWGQTVTVLDTTGAVANADFVQFENLTLEYDYEISPMTSRERAIFQGLPGLQQRLAQLGS